MSLFRKRRFFRQCLECLETSSCLLVNKRLLIAQEPCIAACRHRPTLLPFRAGNVDPAGIANIAAVYCIEDNRQKAVIYKLPKSKNRHSKFTPALYEKARLPAR